MTASAVRRRGEPSSLWVGALKEHVDGLAKHVPTPPQLLLKGEVVRAFKTQKGTGLIVRDAFQRLSVEVRSGEPFESAPQRGEFVEVEGATGFVSRSAPVGLGLVWQATRVTQCGPSKRFRKRREALAAVAATLRDGKPELRPEVREGQVWVITGQRAKAKADVEAAAQKHRWMDLIHHPCRNLLSPQCVAEAVESLTGKVGPKDVALITRGGGDEMDLDVFEDEKVVAALGSLTRRCVTVLAVGHAGDELMTSEVVSHTAATPTAGIHLISQLSWDRSARRPPAPSPSPAPSPPAQVEVREVPIRVEVPIVAKPSPFRWVIRLLVLALLWGALYAGWWGRGEYSSTDAVLNAIQEQARAWWDRSSRPRDSPRPGSSE